MLNEMQKFITFERSGGAVLLASYKMYDFVCASIRH